MATDQIDATNLLTIALLEANAVIQDSTSAQQAATNTQLQVNRALVNLATMTGWMREIVTTLNTGFSEMISALFFVTKELRLKPIEANIAEQEADISALEATISKEIDMLDLLQSIMDEDGIQLDSSMFEDLEAATNALAERKFGGLEKAEDAFKGLLLGVDEGRHLSRIAEGEEQSLDRTFKEGLKEHFRNLIEQGTPTGTPKEIGGGLTTGKPTGLSKEFSKSFAKAAALGPQMLALTLVIKPLSALLQGLLEPLEPIIDIFGAVGDILGLLLVPVVTAVMKILLPILPALTDIVVSLLPLIDLVLLALIPIIFAIEFITAIISQIIEFFSGFLDEIRDIVEDAKDWADGVIETIPDAIEQGVQTGIQTGAFAGLVQ